MFRDYLSLRNAGLAIGLTAGLCVGGCYDDKRLTPEGGQKISDGIVEVIEVNKFMQFNPLIVSYHSFDEGATHIFYLPSQKNNLSTYDNNVKVSVKKNDKSFDMSHRGCSQWGDGYIEFVNGKKFTFSDTRINISSTVSYELFQKVFAKEDSLYRRIISEVADSMVVNFRESLDSVFE